MIFHNFYSYKPNSSKYFMIKLMWKRWHFLFLWFLKDVSNVSKERYKKWIKSLSFSRVLFKKFSSLLLWLRLLRLIIIIIELFIVLILILLVIKIIQACIFLFILFIKLSIIIEMLIPLPVESIQNLQIWETRLLTKITCSKRNLCNYFLHWLGCLKNQVIPSVKA